MLTVYGGVQDRDNTSRQADALLSRHHQGNRLELTVASALKAIGCYVSDMPRSVRDAGPGIDEGQQLSQFRRKTETLDSENSVKKYEAKFKSNFLRKQGRAIRQIPCQWAIPDMTQYCGSKGHIVWWTPERMETEYGPGF